MEQTKRTGYKVRRQSKSTSPLAIDLTSEILLRLPEKSVARFRCVSKLWLSVTTNPYFINLFETRSPRPSTLLCFRKDGNLFVSSIPQHTHTLHRNPNISYSSSQPIETYHIKFPGQEHGNLLPMESVHGLICFEQPENPIVWNPSRKEFLTLPKPRKSWKDLTVFLGYDPVEGKHKVMCMPYRRCSDVCRVLTLGSTQESWRSVKTNHKHRTELLSSGRCIKGVIYYVAYILDTRVWVVMSFDVKSERFDTIELPSNINMNTPATTYKGKFSYVEDNMSTRLWILEDAEKHKWSSQDFLSSFDLYNNERPGTFFILRGFTYAGEFVFAPPKFSRSSYILFYDSVRNSFRRFEFKGIAEDEQFLGGLEHSLHVFPNHIGK